MADLKISIPAPNIQTITVEIESETPLIYHKWSEKAIKMIEDKQQKKATKGRETRNPEDEYKNSYYYNSEGKIAFPANNIKQAMVGACRFLDKSVPMTLIRGAVFVVGDKDSLIPVTYEKDEMRTDMVTVGMGSADVRYRGQLTGWSMRLLIKFNADVISAEQVINLLQIAGFSQGLGEWRPEKNGDFGTFKVVVG
jgi:hypothetical protein